MYRGPLSSFPRSSLPVLGTLVSELVLRFNDESELVQKKNCICMTFSHPGVWYFDRLIPFHQGIIMRFVSYPVFLINSFNTAWKSLGAGDKGLTTG